MNKQLLVQHYPKMVVRNKTNSQQQVLLVGGDSVQAQPNSTVIIMSKDLLQIPDPTIFELVRPTLGDLVAKDIVETERVDIN